MKDKDKLKRLTKSEFDALSDRHYVVSAGDIYKARQKDYDPILRELVREPYDTVLDCGCGVAPIMVLYASRFPNARFVGLDFSQKSNLKAKELLLRNCILIHGDCEKMPLEPNQFDVLFCIDTFRYLTAPQEFLKEARRVLKPGGKLIIRDYTGPAPVLWLFNRIIFPIRNLFRHGDYCIYGAKRVASMCRKQGLRVQLPKKRTPFRLHLVARLPENSAYWDHIQDQELLIPEDK